MAVAPVDRQGILDEIVGADTEKIDFFSQGIRHDHCRGDFDHDADVNIPVVGQAIFFERFGGLIQQLLGLADLEIGGYHWKQYADAAKGRRPQDRPKLGLEHLWLFQTIPYGAQSKGRIDFLVSGVVGHRLVAVDVQGTNGDGLRRHDFDHIPVAVEQFLFAGKVRAVHVLKFRPVKPDAVPPVILHRDNFLRKLDVCHYLQPDTVGRLRFEMALPCQDHLIVFILGFALFILDQRLFARVYDHHAGVAVDDDNIFVFNFRGCVYEPDDSRDLERLGHDAGMGGFAAAIRYKTHNPGQVYAAGVCR